MIRIDRSRVKLPRDVELKLRHEQRELTVFQKRADAGSKWRQQRTFLFRTLALTRPILKKLFQDKCAYCETPVPGQFGDVENFRPKAAIEQADGKVLTPGYWWLAHRWDNLHFACSNCNRLHKRNKFPIAGPRAKWPDVGTKLLEEKPLLLDPCVDDPARFLWFDNDGMVVPRLIRRAKEEDDEFARAKATIYTLGLNRMELVEARLRVRQAVDLFMDGLPTAPPLQLPEPLIGHTRPYLGAAWQWVAERVITAWTAAGQPAPLIHRWLDKSGVPTGITQSVVAALSGRRQDSPITIQIPKTRGRESTATAGQILTSPLFGLESTRPPVRPTPPEALVAQPMFIKRVSIRNYKAIEKLDLDLPVVDVDAPSAGLMKPVADGSEVAVPPDAVAAPPRTGWFVLLGENAVGKSSVLEAIALAAMGESHLQGLIDSRALALRDLVHVPPNVDADKNHRTCIIRLTLMPEEYGEVELRITRSSFKFTKGNGATLPTLIRGYGFARLLPRRRDDADRTIALARCENLFDPATLLCDAERWMASLPFDAKNKSPFDVAASTILALMPRSTPSSADDVKADAAASYLKPKKDKVVMVLGHRELSFDQLSSGYRSIIALAADIMSGLPADRLFDMREACGIVLIDEIGTQLHPRWRMHAANDLRQAFPNMQFIVTTHEPLCLRGVGKNEVAVLHRDDAKGGVTAITKDLPDPGTLRVDQLLTSPMFGLDSTIDPDVDRLFQKYYALLANKEHETQTERAKRVELEAALAPHRGLGYTRSDQLVYELLETFLAKQGARTKTQVRRVDKAVRQQVYDIWRNVAARHRSSS